MLGFEVQHSHHPEASHQDTGFTLETNRLKDKMMRGILVKGLSRVSVAPRISLSLCQFEREGNGNSVGTAPGAGLCLPRMAAAEPGRA